MRSTKLFVCTENRECIVLEFCYYIYIYFILFIAPLTRCLNHCGGDNNVITRSAEVLGYSNAGVDHGLDDSTHYPCAPCHKSDAANYLRVE